MNKSRVSEEWKKSIDTMANIYYAWGDKHTEEDFRKDLKELVSKARDEEREWTVKTILNNHQQWEDEWKDGTWGEFVRLKLSQLSTDKENDNT